MKFVGIAALSILLSYSAYTQDVLINDRVPNTDKTGETKPAEGMIRGRVLDARDSKPLIGANVIVEGTTTGTITNLDGFFELRNLSDQNVSLRISYISYSTVIIDNIEVGKGNIPDLEIKLEEASEVLEDVEVIAKRVTHTDANVLQDMKNSQMVVNGISAQQISRSQDSDAAEVVRRIPGVSLINDRFIVIRGLNERYNTVMLHGIVAPSMESDVRSFSFDVIPSSQIDRIMIQKSPSADLPGEFAGGLIKIYSKSIPDHNGFEISYSNSFRPGSSLRTFQTQEKGPYAWTGFNNHYFDLPDDFPPDLREYTSQPDEIQEAGRSLRNNWVPKEQNTWLDQSLSLTGSFLFRMGKVKIGNVTAVNYGNNKYLLEIERNDFNAYDLQNQLSFPIYHFNDQQNNQIIKVGLIHNWGVQLNKNHKIEFINLFNQTSSYKYINRTGDHLDFGFAMNNHGFQQVYRGLYSGQLVGTHQIFENTKLEWAAGYGISFRDLPDYKQYRTDRPANDINGPYLTYVPIGGAQPYYLGRFYSDMDEQSNTITASLTRKIKFRKESEFVPEISIGIYHEYKERDFLARNIGYTQAVNFDMGLRAVPIDSLFHPDNINNSGGIKIDEQSNPQDSYDASNKLSAGFLMLNLPLTKRFRVVAGIRYENNRRILNSATTQGPVNVDQNDKDFLPSVNLSYNITSKIILRTAYGKTLNRPEFRENAPFAFFDFDYNYVVSGFPYLKSASIDNYDARLEYYPSALEVISAGVFYKNFRNAIEHVFIPGAGSAGSKNYSFGNSSWASITGFEFEIRKSLAGLTSSRFVNDLSIIMNTSFIKSMVEIGAGSRSEGRDTDPRPLQGQSPYLVNATVMYNNIKSDLQINFAYNIIGPRINSAGYTELDQTTVSYPDVYEIPRHLLDFTISKRINRFLTLKAGISDIFNQYSILLQDGNQDEVLDPDADQIIQSYKPGASFTIGLSFKL